MLKELYRKVFAPKIDTSVSNLDRELIQQFNNTRSIRNIRSFCHAPSTNMLFSQDGSVYACCHNKIDLLGKYPAQNLKEIWTNEQAQRFRQQLNQYLVPDTCKICTDDFITGAFNEMRSKHFDSLKPHSGYPVMMEFLLSNKCNLECVMCSGEYSSLIRKNREHLPPIHFPYDDAFVQQLEEFIPYLQEVRFSGSGEAFSIHMNYDIWEKIIQINPKCLIVIQTNGTILNDRVKKMLERGNFQIGISIDSLKKEVFEEIRINANFDKIMANLEYFRDYTLKRKNPFKLSMCVMRNNWMEMPDFIRFCNDNQAIANFHKVWEPSYMGLFNLYKSELSDIHKKLSDITFLPQNHLEKQNHEHYLYYLDVIKYWSEFAADSAESILEYNGEYDHIETFVSWKKNLQTYMDKKVTDTLIAHKELNYCINKQYTILEQIHDPDEKEFALQSTIQVPIEQLYNYLKNNHITFLLNSFQEYSNKKMPR